MNLEVHPAVQPVAFLLGTWRGTGNGDYPTIEPFTYEETVTFEHFGKPFVAYTQRTKGADGGPLHTETGYIRMTEDGKLELVISQPSGITEIHTGTRDNSRLEFTSVTVSLSPSAKQVDRVGRVIEVVGDIMTNELMMSAVGEPYQWHLGATLHRT
ncbi:MAG: FABP family protein [Actinomycetia bacterium]|nr:FABP family protein [Actinomycetes bacterium]